MDMMTEMRIKALINELTADDATPEVARERWDALIARNKQNAERIDQLVAAYPLADDDRDEDGNLTPDALKRVARALRPLLNDDEKQLVIDIQLAKRQQRALEG